MANIKNELNNIKSALYGKDVRGSIHNGIDAINKEVENTTGRQVDLENTFDQLVINAGNSNAEIVDARVKNDGTSYSKLGDRLDAVDSQLAHIESITLDYVNVKQVLGEVNSNTLNGLISTISKPTTLYFESFEYEFEERINIQQKENITFLFSEQSKIKTGQSNTATTLFLVSDSKNINFKNMNCETSNSTSRSNGRKGNSNNKVWLNIQNSSNIKIDGLKVKCGEHGLFMIGNNDIIVDNFISNDCLQPLYMHDCANVNLKYFKSKNNIPYDEQDSLDHHIYLKSFNDNIIFEHIELYNQYNTCSIQVSSDYDNTDLDTKYLKIKNAEVYNVNLFMTTDMGSYEGEIIIDNLKVVNDNAFISTKSNRIPVFQLNSSHTIKVNNFDIKNASGLIYPMNKNNEIYFFKGVFAVDNNTTMSQHLRLLEIKDIKKVFISNVLFLLNCDRYLCGLTLDSSINSNCDITFKDCEFIINGSGQRCMQNGANSTLTLLNNKIINNGAIQDRFLINANNNISYNNIYKNYTLFKDGDTTNIKIE